MTIDAFGTYPLVLTVHMAFSALHIGMFAFQSEWELVVSLDGEAGLRPSLDGVTGFALLPELSLMSLLAVGVCMTRDAGRS